jgi:exopolyphosphatase/guanosine-5'-triphosphate,3'-diphosphate pyrophosphatase
MNELLDEYTGLRNRYDEEPIHSDHVAGLALHIFDGLRSWHGLRSRARELMHCAGLLHDIGWSQTLRGKGHHKASARLIREFKWKHLKAEEVEVVAQVARYHRRKIPQPGHADFQALSPARQNEVMVLGGILRIADALDRTHRRQITSAIASIKPAGILVQVKPAGEWEEELEIFKLKRDMLQLAADRPVRCEEQD